MVPWIGGYIDTYFNGLFEFDTLDNLCAFIQLHLRILITRCTLGYLWQRIRNTWCYPNVAYYIPLWDPSMLPWTCQEPCWQMHDDSLPSNRHTHTCQKIGAPHTLIVARTLVSVGSILRASSASLIDCKNEKRVVIKERANDHLRNGIAVVL